MTDWRTHSDASLLWCLAARLALAGIASRIAAFETRHRERYV